MSGDSGVDNEPILFYTEEMTVSKLIFLKHKGISIDLYYDVLNKLKSINQE
tara:strand:- start:196 stop:348 length:153 start_codon:yes stop_codon:yes gene_type:complete